MHLPNYSGGGIVNLMSSVLETCGVKSPYRPLALKLSRKKTILHIVIDGLGYEFIRKYGAGTIFQEHVKGKLTSVYPSTTTSAYTTLLTGLAPQQHALTGWVMYLKELGCAATTLRFSPYFSRDPFVFDPRLLFDTPSLFERISLPSYFITHKDIAGSVYTQAMARNAKLLPYGTLGGFFRQVRRALSSKQRSFIHAYWPEFDAVCHELGPDHPGAKKHLLELDKHFRKMLKRCKDVVVIVSADHGLIQTTKRKTINVTQHPLLQQSLILPLCGEPRAVFCYVRPEYVLQFERYVKTRLKHACHMYKSSSVIKKGWFGLGNADPRLQERVGDYILVMKENYVLRDGLLALHDHFHPGVHGGLSKEEMYVPLIVIDT